MDGDAPTPAPAPSPAAAASAAGAPSRPAPPPPQQDVISYLTSLLDAAPSARLSSARGGSDGASAASAALAALSDLVPHFAASPGVGGGGTPHTSDECVILLRAVAAYGDVLEMLADAASAVLAGVGCVGVGVGAGGRQGGASAAVAAAAAEDDAAACWSKLSGVAQAAGCAATRVARRSDVARSGVIPALAKIALAPSLATAAATASPGRGGSAPPGSRRAYHPLTAAHPELLQCCLLAGHYRYASGLADRNPVGSVALFRVPPTFAVAAAAGGGSTAAAGPAVPGSAGQVVLPGVTTETYMRYHYLLGMVKVGCEDYDAAAAAFGVCLTAPCRSAISAVQIAARKKLILCRCLIDVKGEGGGVLGGRGEGSSGGASASGSSKKGSGGEGYKVGGRSGRAQRLLRVHPATSPSVSRYLSAASSSSSSSSSSTKPGGGGGNRQSGAEPESTAPPIAAVAAAVSPSGVETPARHRRGGGSGAAGKRERERNYYRLGRYDDLVLAYCSGDAKEFGAARRGMADVLVGDGNLGLANRLEAELRKAAVWRTARVYEAAGLDRVAAESGLGGGAREAEALLGEMLADAAASPMEGGVPFEARIDQEAGTVRFGPYENSEDELDDDDCLDRSGLTERMAACAALAERVRDLDVGIAASNRYQQIAMKGEAQSAAAAARSGGGGKGGESGPKSVAELAG